MTGIASERGDIVLGWLTRVVVLLTVIGVFGFDLIAVSAGRFTADDHANEAATIASQTWLQSHNVNSAYQAAKDSAESHGDQLAGAFQVAADGTVHLTLVHHITTMALNHIGPLRHFGEAKVTVTVRSNTP